VLHWRPGHPRKETVSKRKNIMSEESKKIEKKAEQGELEVKPAELSVKDLDQVAGGGASVVNTSRSNIKDN
jgi:hypothetical protein